jgi:hypothetical protein
MDIPIAKDFIPLNKITHNIRSGQAVMEYGVGAMVDFVDQTLMTTTPELWDESIVHIHDERLERVLGVDFFGMPGGKDEYHKGLTYTRFPQWYFCPRCRRFQPLKEWITEYRRKATPKKREKDSHMKRPRCLDCKTDLVPARIVVACKSGHIDDFPWVEWAHEKNTGGEKPLCNNPTLKFETGANTTAGLEGLVIRCESCNAKATLFGSFDKDAMEKLNNYTCSGFMPWKNKHVSCGCIPQAVQRGASKIYYPKVASSLVIPPYSDRLNTSIEKSKRYAECLTIINEYEPDEKESQIRSKLDKWSNEIAKQIARDPLAVKRILERRFFKEDSDNDNELMTNQKYRIEEYEALTGAISEDAFEGSDFIREEQSVDLYPIRGLKRVVLVHKVREVRVLTAFSRLNPPAGSILGAAIEGENGLICVKEPDSNWYPGYEVRGEGIFLEFDDEEINLWSSKFTSDTGDRAAILNEQYSSSYQGQFLAREISPKFILLHTLSHLLIRQLSFECGYTAASLRERIYCNVSNENYIMSGILIYTASGDSEGTLGGLVRQGRSDCLPCTFFKALETAKWCSNDPVCIQSHGQGRESLNLAACHTCTLLPETSCEEFNVFLDRGLVIGTLKNEQAGFFSEWLVQRRFINEKTGE